MFYFEPLTESTTNVTFNKNLKEIEEKTFTAVTFSCSVCRQTTVVVKQTRQNRKAELLCTFCGLCPVMFFNWKFFYRKSITYKTNPFQIQVYQNLQIQYNLISCFIDNH